MYTTRQRRPGTQQQPPFRQSPWGSSPSSSSSSFFNKKKKKNNNKGDPLSRKQQLLLFISTFLGLAVWYLTPVSDLLVQVLLETVPLEADLELGRQALQQQFARQTLYDRHWTPKIQRIGSELVHANPQAQPYTWDFGVLHNPQEPHVVNAFALPGGIVRVTQALLDTLQLTDGELAALLGHEMGHVLHRHSQARILQRQVLTTILKALVYQDDDPHQESFGEAIGELLLQSADWLGQQSFSRANEYQADATSWDLLVHSAKYHPQAVESLLSKLWDYHGRQGGQTSWDSTHPGTLDRIQALEEKFQALSTSERRKLQRNKVR
eukprot:Nitzschia sp. Nitz4//scaffold383_size13514//3900//4868//NITZ4_008975-RA/size13514-processed-gene-0.4-mRNA-1//-1//CDS//3329549936//9080//frame0